MAKLKITLKRSKNNRIPKHRATLEALGLRKIGQSVEREDTPSVRGQINKIAFMLDVEEVK